MPLRKPIRASTIKPYLTANFSQDFNSGLLVSSTNLSDIVASSNEYLILLNRENYTINTSAVCPAKYIKGVLSQGRGVLTYYPNVHISQPMRISGTWVFENVYITGNAIQLLTGAKLILRNCYLYFTSNVSFVCIDATNGTLIMENSVVDVYEIGSASIRVRVGSEVYLYNSSVKHWEFGQATGTLVAENSGLGVNDSGVDVNGYNINLNNCYFGWFKGGWITLDARYTLFGRMGAYIGHRGIQGKAIQCHFNNFIISNSTISNVKFYNCSFEKVSDPSWTGIVSAYSGSPIMEFYNCVFYTGLSNEYILNCNNSSAVVKFINCSFRSTTGRFTKLGSGTNNIRTVNCVGNKDITTDSGFNAGEVNDTGFIFDANF
jgi:hypothetical protein